jgi:hypothetical protein
MNRGTRDLLFIVAGLLLSAVTLWAGAGYDKRLSRDVAYLNSLGGRPTGAKNLERSMASAFRTDVKKINELRREKLGTGDIAAVFAVASRLGGGLTDANVKRIVKLWKEEGVDNWAAVARSLGVRLRSVVLKVESVGSGRRAASVAANSRTASPAQPSAAKSPAAGHDTLKALLHKG